MKIISLCILCLAVLSSCTGRSLFHSSGFRSSSTSAHSGVSSHATASEGKAYEDALSAAERANEYAVEFFQTDGGTIILIDDADEIHILS